MSLDQVLLIAFLVVLPLVQHIVGLIRKQNKLPERAGPPIERRPPTQEQQPQPPHTARRIAIREAAAAAPALPVEWDASLKARRHTGANSKNAFDLRRAIVLMSLVGPCRAERPHDWPDTGRHL
jgi:hypothetical protein